jgi:uncharacterized membrane protein YobD (UPF0266 family)
VNQNESPIEEDNQAAIDSISVEIVWIKIRSIILQESSLAVLLYFSNFFLVLSQFFSNQKKGDDIIVMTLKRLNRALKCFVV